MVPGLWPKIKKQEQKELSAGQTFTTKRLIEYVQDIDRLTQTANMEELSTPLTTYKY